MSVGEKVLKRAIQVPSIDVESDVWALRSGTGLGVGECKFRLNVVQPTTNPGVPRCVVPSPLQESCFGPRKGMSFLRGIVGSVVRPV